jgi:hypothetical protein
MFQLPVSGLPVVVRQPTGVEDLLLREARSLDARFALVLLERMVRSLDNAPMNWSELAVTDLEASLLWIRRVTLGDLVRAETNCNSTACKARVDVSFRIDEYLASRKCHVPRGVTTRASDGWYCFADAEVRFRLPTSGDLLAVESHPHPDRELLRRCVEPAKIPSCLRSRIVRAMQVLAPPLSGTLTSKCPECHAVMQFSFEIVAFVLRELRDYAAAIYQEVHLLALYYKWPEEHILALPRERRTHYVEALRSQGSAA